MTNADLKRKYNAVFPYFYLYNNPALPGQTLLVGTHRKPTPTGGSFGYAPAVDDFVKIQAAGIVAAVRIK